MGAEAAGEEAIAIGDMADVARAAAAARIERATTSAQTSMSFRV